MVVIVVLLLIGSFMPCGALTASSYGVGPVCGEHTCARHGHCAFKKGERNCVCNRRYHGIGHFICVEPNEKYCVIFNDPSIKSFDGSHITAPGEQMTFAAHVTAKPCYKEDHGGYAVKSHGSCDVRVYLWYCRRAGKFFVCGTVVKVILFLNNTAHYHTTRIHARAKRGHYSFREEGQKYEFGNGQYGDPVVTTVPGLGQIKTVYDRQEHFAFVDIAICGVKVGLRPADSVWNPLMTPAGLVVITTDECETNYLSAEQTICVPPNGKGPSLDEQIEDLSKEVGEPVTKDDLACHKVICGDVNQNFPGAQTNLNNLHETCNSCDKKTLIHAIQQCCFILHHPTFINCYDHLTPSSPKGSNKLINLLDECLFSLCAESQDMCKMVQNSIHSSGCAGKLHSTQHTILNSTCHF